MISLNKKENQRSHVLMPALISACAIPISMLFWFVNVIYSTFYLDSENHFEEHLVVSPWRWLTAVVIPIFMALWGLKRKSVDVSGAVLGLFMGFILTLTSFCHLACLFAFFVTSSKATKFRAHQKRKLEADFKHGGQRNWIQVLCNGGMATQLALLYLLDVGCVEQPIHFDKHYRSSWLSIGILGAFACCNGDTWASEIGSVVGSKDPFLITSFKRVPKGTNGGVSWVGLAVSALGGMTVGLFDYLIILLTVDTAVLQLAAPQWPIIIVGGIGGLFGSVTDSLLGATLQYSGVNEKGVIVEHPGKGVKHVCGRQILDNHSVNLLSSVLTALILPEIAKLNWP
ncbi:transmembrane protein 19 isoform X1 [Osmia bicornis bicornis]|uniref:transmembrane protein 19 isoform X1 n=2 Tax=Osmia bicornis bicornis TaxID=1437191 RepID=UPI0010F54BC4|nr:transmembrane protein 19 isoform X1 [Osmia bicornis bicornis]XP_029035385.1 transmembrane protein 19 isoform X1 [Osmia bicornis bicornis]